MRGGLLALLAVVPSPLAGLTAAEAPPSAMPASCRHQSSAAFAPSRRDLRVGPLVMVGARTFSPPDVIAEFGGQKYPVLVRDGHRVTVALDRGLRGASLLYADDHRTRSDGERTVADGHRAVAFRACSNRRASSTYGRAPVTFWSGFVLTTTPRCLRLRIWVDEERTPREARLALGRRCGAATLKA